MELKGTFCLQQRPFKSPIPMDGLIMLSAVPELSRGKKRCLVELGCVCPEPSGHTSDKYSL